MNIQYPHLIENVLGEKLIFKGIEMEEGEEKMILEGFVEPGAGPAMHVHFRQDEALTVLEGKVGFEVQGEAPRYAGPGETVLFERGTPHRFWNAGEGILHLTGWVKPANSIAFFLSALYDAQNRAGDARPELFDGAWLVTRYASEYDLPELPGFVKKVVMPATVAVGKVLGKYEKFAGAPEPLG